MSATIQVEHEGPAVAIPIIQDIMAPVLDLPHADGFRVPVGIGLITGILHVILVLVLIFILVGGPVTAGIHTLGQERSAALQGLLIVPVVLLSIVTADHAIVGIDLQTGVRIRIQPPASSGGLPLRAHHPHLVQSMVLLLIASAVVVMDIVVVLVVGLVALLVVRCVRLDLVGLLLGQWIDDQTHQLGKKRERKRPGCSPHPTASHHPRHQT